MDDNQVIAALPILLERRLPPNTGDFSSQVPATVQLCVTKTVWGVDEWEMYDYHIQGCTHDGEVYYVTDMHISPGLAFEDAERDAASLLRAEG